MEEEQTQGINVDWDNKKFITDFYKIAFVVWILEWIGTGMKEDPRELIERVHVLNKGDFQKFLEMYAKK